MAVLSVPRPLQERLGEAATESLVEMLRQIESDQEERREVQKEQLLQVLEERFLRHVAESEQRTPHVVGKASICLPEALPGERTHIYRSSAPSGRVRPAWCSDRASLASSSSRSSDSGRPNSSAHRRSDSNSASTNRANLSCSACGSSAALLKALCRS